MKLNRSLKRRVCKSYKEFKKIERKYEKYFNFWNCKHWEQFRWKLNNIWFIWIEYRIDTLDELKLILKQLNKPFVRNQELVFKNLLNQVIKNYGNEYLVGKLIGLSVTNEDYYYIYENADGKRTYSTCVAKLGE
jgi:hypothetical protein